MKSFSQFCSESVYFTEMSDFVAGGGNAKMRETGMSRDQVIALGQKNLARLKNKPAATKSKAATTPNVVATTSTSTAAPAPRPRDPRPTNREVAAARRESEYQRNARNLRLGVELGGIAADQARQNYATQNSPAMRAHRAQMAASVPQWKQHQFTQDSPAPVKPKDRDYGIPDFVSDRRRENRGAMYDQLRSDGMSPADARKEAARREAELHGKNLKYQQNRRYGYSD